MSVYENRINSVKEWADDKFGKDTKVYHQIKSKRLSNYVEKLSNNYGYAFDHCNEIKGIGIVSQPYEHEYFNIPPFAEIIQLPEDWNDGVITLFMPLDVLKEESKYN